MKKELSTTQFRANHPHVIFENIEGETIILNLERGTYYNLNGTGMYAWELIQNGTAIVDVVTKFRHRYPAVAASDIASDITALVAVLEREQLVVPLADGETAQETTAPTDDAPDGYEKPHINVFSDLQSLLLLDPIHDVDEMGWPHQA